MKLYRPITKIGSAPVALTAGITEITFPKGIRLLRCDIGGKAGAAQQIAAGFGDVALFWDDREQRRLDITEYNAVHKLYNPTGVDYFGFSNDVNGGLFIAPHYFGEPWRKQYAAAEFNALDILEDSPDVRLTVAVKAAATAPALSFDIEYEPLSDIRARGGSLNLDPDSGLPLLTKWFKKNVNVNAAILDIESPDDFPIVGADRFSYIGLTDPAGATIDKVTITKNLAVIYESTKAKNDRALKEQDMTPVTGRFDIVPDKSDNPLDQWRFRKSDSIKLHLELSASVNAVVKMVTTRVGTPN